MASKWKYRPLIQQDEKEEETVLINNPINFTVNGSNPFNPINNLENLDLTNTKDHDSKFELKQRGSLSQTNQIKNKDNSIELVEYYIKPNDSLLSISLSCNCSVEELKRVNKLITDQEFYGLRYIKIPVRKYGLLSEVLIHQSNQPNKSISIKEVKESLSNPNLTSLTNESTNSLSINQSINPPLNNLLPAPLINSLSPQQPLKLNNDQFLNSQPLINFNDDDNEVNQPNQLYKPLDTNATSSKSSSTNSLIVNVGLKKTFEKTDSDLNKFLVYLDKDLEKMRKATNKHSSIIKSSLSPEDHLYISNYQSTSKTMLDCNGADCNLTWKSAIFIAIFICILVPLIYLAIYAEEKSLNHYFESSLVLIFFLSN